MSRRRNERDSWEDQAGDAADYGEYDQYADEYGDEVGDDAYVGDDDRGLILQTEQSLVNISSTVTQHGAPLLSYTRTMNRFYQNRRQRLSLGRYACEVCGERIRLWAWETPNGNRTHDGCYERLAWTWTNLYAQQQALASRGQFE
ncbi:MAG TPA: hypothetical protein VF725_00485 [Ktedonobacterales bacterium]|jgi:hypothetical protein